MPNGLERCVIESNPAWCEMNTVMLVCGQIMPYLWAQFVKMPREKHVKTAVQRRCKSDCGSIRKKIKGHF